MGNIRAAGKLCIKHPATKPAMNADLPSLLFCLHPGQVACLCERLKTAPHSLSIHIAREATRHCVLPAGPAQYPDPWTCTSLTQHASCTR